MDDGPGDGTAYGREYRGERRSGPGVEVGADGQVRLFGPDGIERQPPAWAGVARFVLPTWGEREPIERRPVGWYAGPGGYYARRRNEPAAGDHNHYDRVGTALDVGRVPAQCPDCGRSTGSRTVAGLFQVGQDGYVRGGRPSSRWCPACLRRRDREAVAHAVREAGRDVWDQAEPMVRRHVRDGWAWANGVIDPPIDWAVDRADAVVDRVADAVGPVVAAAVDVASVLAPIVHTVERWRYDRRAAQRRARFESGRTRVGFAREWLDEVVRGRGPSGHGDVD